MAATFAYSAATKCNILALTGPRVVQFCSLRRFTAIQTSNKFPVGRGSALFCTAPPNQEVFVLAGEDQPPPRQSIKELADLLDIRVGRVVKAWRHEEADSLYVEEVDVGEPEPRVICSGLVAHVPLEHLQGLSVVVLANLKPRNMRGVKSSGMLMAASDSSHSTVELLVPPTGSLPGDRVWFDDRNHDHDHDHHYHDDGNHNLPVPATPNQIQKKKVWEAVQPHLKTDGDFVAVLSPGYVMRTSAGVVRSRSLNNANIS